MADVELQVSNSVFIDEFETSWGQLLESGWRCSISRVHDIQDGPVAVVVSGRRHSLEVLATVAANHVDAAIIDAERFTPMLEGSLRKAGFSVCRFERTPAVATRPARVWPSEGLWILSSGTTGPPKAVWHPWRALVSRRADSRRAFRWLVPFATGTFAWSQLMSRGLFIPGEEIVVASQGDVSGQIEAALRWNATAVSATPTFWRLALLQAGERNVGRLALSQITLGGEVVDQPILDTLRHLFPGAHISHIYASTEAGVCAVVHDGKAGFPETWLQPTGFGRSPIMAVENSRLLVGIPSFWGDTSREPFWLDTGDRVEIRDGRVIVVGRGDESLISVGGMKVSATEVEAVLLSHPAVVWCRVAARKAPLVGNLVGAIIAASTTRETSPEDLASALHHHCRDRLPEHAIPRQWSFTSTIPTGENYKST